MFKDRSDAGRQLAERLAHLRRDRQGGDQPVVLGFMRGGIAVGYEVACALRAPLDVLLVRRVPSRDDPDEAVGTVVNTHPPHAFISRDAIERLDMTADAAHEEGQRQLHEIERLAATFRAGRPKADVEGRTVILVDEGTRGGGTLGVALRALREAGAARLVLAVPVIGRAALDELSRHCDEVVAIATPDEIGRVEFFFEDWGDVGDVTVIDLMEQAGRLR